MVQYNRGSLAPFGRAVKAQISKYRIPLYNTAGMKGIGFGLGTCGRTNTGWYFDPADGLLKSATSGNPRIEAKGVLIEPAATNYCLQSRELTTSPWINYYASFLHDETGIDGATNSAWTVTDDDPTVAEHVYQNVTVPNDNDIHCSSLFFKKTRTAVIFPGFRCRYIGGSGLSGDVIVNTNLGTLHSVDGASPNYKSIEDHGDWWRVSVAKQNDTSGNTTCRVEFYPAISTDGTTWSPTVTGSTVVDHGQFEKSTLYPTSPIITTTSEVTRNTDAAEYTWPTPSAVTTLLQSSGTMTCLWTPQYNSDDDHSNCGILSMSSNQYNMIYISQGASRVTSYDATTLMHTSSYPWIKGETFLIAVRWGFGGEYEIGWNRGAGWDWSNPTSFDGAFSSSGTTTIGINALFPFHLKNIYFYELLTRTQIEEMF